MRRLLDDHIVKYAYAKIAQADGVDETRELINRCAVELDAIDQQYGFRLEDLFVYAQRLNDSPKKLSNNTKKRNKKKEIGIEMDAFFELLNLAGVVDDELTQLEIRQVSFVALKRVLLLLLLL